MSTRVVIDPITRIEGHLRIELETEGTSIQEAWSETTQFRGIETIVKDRDPRDAWAFLQRVCGVCTTTHAIASVVAVENAIGSQPPQTARLIRDLVLASQGVQDHVIHFYHLHALDWVNVPSAATADPAAAVEFAASIGSTWKGNTVERMTQVRDTVQGILDSGQLSIFTGGYWGHPDYRLPAEANLMAVAHYLDALEFQRSMIRIGTVFGGKNPHPNFLVGGMACTIDMDKSESINEVQIDQIAGWIAETTEFVRSCYLPDAMAIMSMYTDYFDIGAAQPHFFAVGLNGATFVGDPADSRVTSPMSEVAPGVLLDGDYATVHPFDPTKIVEYASSAWYTTQSTQGLTPDKGETTPDYTGPTPPYTWLADHEKYTWSKAPRYDGRPVQVGPVARILVAYAQGHQRTVELVDHACRTLAVSREQLNSTGGRTLARAIDAVLTAEIMAEATFPHLLDSIKRGDTDVFDASKWEPSSWPDAAMGYSFVEVARGNLSHWLTIENGKISRYQAVVPTTWLAGGRDHQGKRGPYEEALAAGGTHPLVDAAQPLEPLRTIHSFDPCMSCAVHVLDPDGEQIQVVTS